MSQLDDSVLDQPDSTTSPAPGVAPATTREVYGVIAEFDTTHKLLEAIASLRELGYRLEAYTPFPVHGIDEALGLKRSRLGWVVLASGLAGAGAALLLQWWTGTVSYPLVIAGKPFFALEFSIPITFELTVLFAAIGGVLGMLLSNSLPRFYHPAFNHPRFERATDDRFLLAVEADGAEFDIDEAVKALQHAGGRHPEVVAA